MAKLTIDSPVSNTTIPTKPGGELSIKGILELPKTYTHTTISISFNNILYSGDARIERDEIVGATIKKRHWSYTGNIPRIVGNLEITANTEVTNDNVLEPISTPEVSHVNVVVEDKVAPIIDISEPTNNIIPLPTVGLDLKVAGSVKDDYYIRDVVVEWKYENDASETKPIHIEGDIFEVNWHERFHINPEKIGNHIFKVRASDKAGNAPSEKVITVISEDKTPPSCTIVSPTPDKPGTDLITIPNRGSGGRLKIIGEARDNQTGVFKVWWKWDGKPDEEFREAQPTRPGWEEWTVTIEGIRNGFHTIIIKYQDNAHIPNKDSLQVKINVIQTFQPRDINNLGPRDYLDDLIEFAKGHIITSSPNTPHQFLTMKQLDQIFCHYFEVLDPARDPSSVIAHDQLNTWLDKEVNQVGISIGILRKCALTTSAKLLAHWKFDDVTDNNTAADSSGNGNNGILIGGPTWDKSGKIGTTLSFDGVDDYVTVQNAPILEVGKNGSDFCVAFWIYLNQGFSPVFRSIIHKGKENGQRTFGLWMNPQNHVHYRVSTALYPDEGWSDGGDSNSEIPVNSWTHITYLKAGNALRLYINGKLDSEAPLSHLTIDNTGPIYIGKDPWHNGINGKLDDIRVYDGTLPRASIALLSAGLDIKEAHSINIKAAESSYLQASYQIMLNKIGSSYEELRLLRMEERDKRDTVSSRLQIFSPLSDRIEELFVEPDKLTENKLEDLFGLINTSREPWEAKPQPAFLKWRIDFMERVWRQHDYPEQNDKDFETTSRIPLIEPDIIDEQDLANQTTGIAFTLLQNRKQQIREELDKLHQHGNDDTALAYFSKIVNSTIKIPQGVSLCEDSRESPTAFLQCLKEQLDQGNDIEPILDLLYLNIDSFFYLFRIKALAEKSGIVTDSEWDDVCNILLYVKKRQNYGLWRKEEKPSIALIPQFFKISPIPKNIVKWRATSRDRRNWQETLQIRIDRILSTTYALESDVREVEEATLPILRDALLSAISMDNNTSESAADKLTQHLLTDMKGASSQRTTYLMYAIQTLQGLIFSLRTKRFDEDHPAYLWRLADETKDFDEQWKFRGSYDGWYAATLVFYLPEIVLFPNLRKGRFYSEDKRKQIAQTEGFTIWSDELQSNYNQNLTPDIARKEANRYLRDLKNKDENISALDKIKALVSVSEDVSDQIETKLGGYNNFTITEEDLTVDKLENLRRQNEDLLDPNSPVYAELKDYDLKMLCIKYFKEIFFFVPLQLALQLQKSGEYIAALDWYQTIYAYNLPLLNRKIYYGIRNEKNDPIIISLTTDWLLKLNPHEIANDRPNPYTRFVLMNLARCFLEFADAEFTRNTSESISKATSLYMTCRSLLLLDDLKMLPSNDDKDALLSNPLLDTLKSRVESQLSKIRQGRSITGIKRPLENYASASKSAFDKLIMYDNSDISNRPAIRPTPYRYSILIERSKQLVSIAQQVESSYLSALEKFDAEDYTYRKAMQALGLSTASIQLHEFRGSEAQSNIDLAQAQKTRILGVQETYDNYLKRGINSYEYAMLSDYKKIRDLKKSINSTDATLQLAQLGIQMALASKPSHLFGLDAAVAAPVVLFAGQTAAFKIFEREGENARLVDAENSAQVNSFWANYQRQKEQLQMQKEISYKDLAVSEEQIKVAEAHKKVVEQERSIAIKQQEYDKSTLQFLANKFTNRDLYAFVISSLAGVYRYFLQQAASMAQLAQSQLEFERQEKVPSFIIADYWQQMNSSSIFSSSYEETTGSTTTTKTTTGDKTTDMRGITGSSRLLQDIYRLDQFAFEKNKRKLNLVQSFSLAQLFPLQFQRFKETGVMQFNIPMELFDRKFPGHYLRLIKRIRTSVVALIPQIQGISATLISSGISRVAVKNEGIFEDIEVTRTPEIVALTSPLNATGVFEMDAQSEMLLPFESNGVATSWELQMPKASNQFDYSTISDVLFTIEYTALNDFDYKQQVIKSLDTQIGGERPFSFKESFPDQWYYLQNSEFVEDTDKKMVVRFNIERHDFPANIENLGIQNVLVYFAPGGTANTENSFEVTARLSRICGSSIIDGGEATSQKGIISTSRNMWSNLIDQEKPTSPLGEWELSIIRSDATSNNTTTTTTSTTNTTTNLKTKDITKLFQDGDIEDILFVISYAGNIPEWPTA